jgi:putative FmdB family regulatory protein
LMALSANALDVTFRLGGHVPTYEYACTECGDRLEVVQRFSDDPLTLCSACGGRLRKVFSPVGIVFKGSGFYRTDSRSGAVGAGANGNGKSADGSAGSEGGSGDKAETGGKSEAGAKSETGKSGSDGGSGSSKTSDSGGSSNGSAGASKSGKAAGAGSSKANSKVA